MYLFRKFLSTENAKYFLLTRNYFELQVGYNNSDNFHTLAECISHLIAVLGETSKYHLKTDILIIKQPQSIELVTLKYGLHQISIESTYVLDNSSSCIDLIFTSQPNLVVDSGVYPSLHANCHHQIVYAKFNLKIHFTLPYERKI